mgnify:CR=1 FL=1
MSEQIFTLGEVEKLHKHQFGPWAPFEQMHPYTCENRGDGKHFLNGGDLGILIPTIRGWVCQCCNYTQTWAHGMGKKP